MSAQAPQKPLTATQTQTKFIQEQEIVRQALLDDIDRAKKFLQEKTTYPIPVLDLLFYSVELRIKSTVTFLRKEEFELEIKRLTDDCVQLVDTILNRGKAIETEMSSKKYQYQRLIRGNVNGLYSCIGDLEHHFKMFYYNAYQYQKRNASTTFIEFNDFEYPPNMISKLHNLLAPFKIQESQINLLELAISLPWDDDTLQNDFKKLTDLLHNATQALDGTVLTHIQARMKELEEEISFFKERLAPFYRDKNECRCRINELVWELEEVPDAEKDELRRNLLPLIYPEEHRAKLAKTLSPKIDTNVATNEEPITLSPVRLVKYFLPAFLSGVEPKVLAQAGDSKSQHEGQRLNGGQLGVGQYTDYKSLLDWNKLGYSGKIPFDYEARQKQKFLENEENPRKIESLCAQLIELSREYRDNQLDKSFFLSTQIRFLIKFSDRYGNGKTSAPALLIDELYEYCHIKGANNFDRLVQAMKRIMDCFSLNLLNFEPVGNSNLLLIEEDSLVPLNPSEVIRALLRGIMDCETPISNSKDIEALLKRINLRNASEVLLDETSTKSKPSTG